MHLAMPDLSELTTHIERLAGRDLSRSNEQDTREWAVNPVIGALKWNVFDPNEVNRDYSVLGGQVDYCLRAQGHNLVLIKVKCGGEDLSEHWEQLLHQAFDERAPLAVLTDGLIWWLYLILSDGIWEQRRLFRFFSVDFHDSHPADAAEMIYRFLNRDSVIDGEAQRTAVREFRCMESQRVVQESLAIDEAWRQILDDPNGLLHDLLEDAAEEVLGCRPDSNTVTNFLHDILRNMSGEDEKATSQLPAKALVPPSSAGPELNPEETPQCGSMKKKPTIRLIAFWLDGKRYEVMRWGLLPARVCEVLAREAVPELAERLAEVRGRGPYFASSANALRRPVEISGTGLYAEGNISAELAERIVRRVLRTIRGSDEGFHIERAELPSGS